MTDSSYGSTSYGYNNRDMVKVITSTITGSPAQVVSYSYDPAGNRQSMSTPAGTTNYGYDFANRLRTVSNSAHFTGNASYDYNDNGTRKQLTLTNGITVSYSYDELDRLRNITQSNSTGTLASYSYTLDKAGNRRFITETLTLAGGGGTTTRNLSYGYDEAYRLTNETVAETGQPTTSTDYHYDASGNRLWMASGSQQTNYSYNELDQLMTVISGTTRTENS